MTADAHGNDRRAPQGASTISLARKEIGDLLRPNPLIYWADFGLSTVVGYAAAIAYCSWPVFAPNLWATQPWIIVLTYVVAGLALYRLASFMHEVVHFRDGEMRGFRTTWDIVAGIPMLTPSFFYEAHLGHHNTHKYGTEHDGEYLPLGHGSVKNVLFFFAQVFLQPALVAFRFVVLTPISLLVPSWRRAILQRASSFVINLKFRRPLPEKEPTSWKLMDLACCLRASTIFVFAIGWNAPLRVFQLYSLAVFILTMNYVRTLVAHRYRGEGDSMTHREQLLDSTNISGGWLTELGCPLGLRYHALHHLFPAIPYHNLGVAHRRLMQRLPENSEYFATVCPSYWSVIHELFSEMGSEPDSQAEKRAA